MRTIEKVKMIKSLRAGELVWEAGTILPREGEFLHPTIIEEVRLNTGTVEVLSYKDGSPVEESGLKVPLNENTLLQAGIESKEVDAKIAAEKAIKDSEARERKAIFDEIEELKLLSSQFEKALAELKTSFLNLKNSFTFLEASFDDATKPEKGTPTKQMSEGVSSAKTKQVVVRRTK